MVMRDVGTRTVLRDMAASTEWGGQGFVAAAPGASATVQIRGAGAPRCAVAILSASIPEDRITVELAPQGVSGTLTVELVQGGTTHTVFSDTRGGGVHNISFNIPNLPTGEFSQVRATWQAGGQNPSAIYNYHIKVLGMYRHTQYNSPHENNCSGDPSPVTIYAINNNSCVQTPNATMRGGFIDRVLNPTYGTGSGHSINYGDVGKEFFCSPRPYPTARRDIVISGSMGTLSNSTVAVHPDSGAHEPNAQLYIHGVGVKSVTDTCGVCGAARIDHYTTNMACIGIGDLLPERAMTIRIY
jgi:hypothetical protein